MQHACRGARGVGARQKLAVELASYARLSTTPHALSVRVLCARQADGRRTPHTPAVCAPPPYHRPPPRSRPNGRPAPLALDGERPPHSPAGTNPTNANEPPRDRCTAGRRRRRPCRRLLHACVRVRPIDTTLITGPSVIPRREARDRGPVCSRAYVHDDLALTCVVTTPSPAGPPDRPGRTNQQ